MSTFPPEDSDPLPYYTKVPYWTHFAEQGMDGGMIKRIVGIDTTGPQDDGITRLLAGLREQREAAELERDALARVIEAYSTAIAYLERKP